LAKPFRFGIRCLALRVLDPRGFIPGWNSVWTSFAGGNFIFRITCLRNPCCRELTGRSYPLLHVFDQRRRGTCGCSARPYSERNEASSCARRRPSDHTITRKDTRTAAKAMITAQSIGDSTPIAVFTGQSPIVKIKKL